MHTFPDRRLVSASAVKRKLGDCSAATLWRLRHRPESGFPAAIRINGRLYWYEHEVDAWLERAREAA